MLIVFPVSVKPAVLLGVSRVHRQTTPREVSKLKSSRMTTAMSSLILLLCLLRLSASLDLPHSSKRESNTQMPAVDDHHHSLKYAKNDGVIGDFRTTSKLALKYIVTEKERLEQKQKLNTPSTFATKSSGEGSKKLTLPMIHSLVPSHMSLSDNFRNESQTDQQLESYRDNFRDESQTDQQLESYRDNFRDEFRCRPCLCYFTFSHSIVASCNSSIDQIKAVLPNETQQLTISASNIRVFYATDFLQYHMLHNLTVTRNGKLSTIANSSISNRALTVQRLDFSLNSVNTIMDRSFVMFTNLLILNLEHNKINTISNLTFEGLTNLKYLNLSGNPLSMLTAGSLHSFHKLEVLDLSCEHILKLVPLGFFSTLVGLSQLYMNGKSKNVKRYPNGEIARLTNLTFLSITAISEKITLGPEIKNLKQLVTLHLGFLMTKDCHLENIPETFLENVPYLQTLRFSNCPLRSVDANVYMNVKELRSLEFISTYPYDIFKALDGLSGLQNSSLSSLRLIGLIQDGCPFICLYARHAQYLGDLNMEVIDLSFNRVGYIDKWFINALPHTLKELVLQGNKLLEPSLLIDKLTVLENLVLIDLGNPESGDEGFVTKTGGEVSQTHSSNIFTQSYRDSVDRDVFYDIESLEDFKSADSGKVSIERIVNGKNVVQVAPVCREPKNTDDSKDFIDSSNTSNKHSLKHGPGSVNASPKKAPKLKYILAHGFVEVNLKDMFKTIRQYGYTNMRHIDLSYCALPSVTRFSFLPRYIEVAIFNGNYIRHMHGRLFRSNSSLKHLSLSNNILGNMFARTGEKVFMKLGNLEYLDISKNMIYELSHNFFAGLNNLKYLIISDNKLAFLNTNFSTMPNLEYLDLRKNSIVWISKNNQDELDSIGTDHPLYIELTNNSLRCSCEGLELLHWIWASNIHFVSKDVLKCVRDDNRIEDMGDIAYRVRSLQRECAGKSLIIVLCVASLVVISFLIVFGVMYRYRWQLRYIRNIALSKFMGFKPRDTESSEYRFDAFIVYSDMSRRFVFRKCLQELEVKRGHKLCVDDRNFMPGTYDVSAILSAIQNSKKTLLVLSPDFYEEQFSEYCVKMALMEEIYQKRSVLYLCVYRPLPDDEMSKSYDLLMIMNRNNYMEFPPETETSDEVRQHFWDQLSQKIGHSSAKEIPNSAE